MAFQRIAPEAQFLGNQNRLTRRCSRRAALRANESREGVHARLAAERRTLNETADCGRYPGVLRALAAESLTIGLCWLLTADDHGQDGELRKYLNQPSKWRRHDSDLYDKLTRLKQPGVRRTVRHC